MKKMTEEQIKLRQYYVLNLIANMNANYAAENEQDLESNIRKIKTCLSGKNKVPGLVSDWKVVWGPAIGNSNKTYEYKPRYRKSRPVTCYATDNAMYVAQKVVAEGEPNEYFIGISGTNGISLTGWFDQDFNVGESVEWPPEKLNIGNVEVKGKPSISKASCTGIEALWKLTPGSEAEKTGMSLINFIMQATKGDKCSISIGGHSLGGCLTPLLATAIADKLHNLDKGSENIKEYKDVVLNAYPTAGPTPGNQDFALHLQDKMNEYHAVYNANDIVPLAWDFEGLSGLIKAYKTWKFGKNKITPGTRLVSNFIHGIMKFPKDEIYTRSPEKPESKFRVTTWENQLIPKLKKKGVISVEFAVNQLSKLMMRDSIKSELLKIYSHNNEGKLPSDKEFQKIVKPLARFLMQILLQHVSAYSNPIATGDTPWEFSDDENTAISKLFKRDRTSEKSIAWSIYTSVELLARLSEKAAKALKTKDGEMSIYFEDMVPAEYDSITDESEDELIGEIEDLLEESPELVGDLPFFGNPYS